MMTVDEKLFLGDSGNAAILSGTVDMSVSGDMLTIILTNTTAVPVLEGNGAGNLMTGVGWTMPDGFSIIGGTATVEAGSQIGTWNTITTDISNEWGYANLIDSGHFSGSPSFYMYRSVVGTVTADVDFPFAAGSNGTPSGLDGPDFGLLSDLVAASVAGGQTAAQSPITLVLKLNQSVVDGSAFLSYIESQPVGIAFASPDSTSVPEPSTFVLAALAFLGAVLVLRRRSSRPGWLAAGRLHLR